MEWQSEGRRGRHLGRVTGLGPARPPCGLLATCWACPSGLQTPATKPWGRRGVQGAKAPGTASALSHPRGVPAAELRGQAPGILRAVQQELLGGAGSAQAGRRQPPGAELPGEGGTPGSGGLHGGICGLREPTPPPACLLLPSLFLFQNANLAPCGADPDASWGARGTRRGDPKSLAGAGSTNLAPQTSF